MLLLDFSPIKTGGGAQLALNFLYGLQNQGDVFPISTVLVSDKFPWIDRLGEKHDVIVAPSAALSRVAFETFSLPRMLRERGITKSYTFFGPGLPAVRGLRQLVGVAYPILVYDDSVYWRLLPPLVRMRRRLRNFARKRRIRNATHVLFETEVMRQRAIRSGLVGANSSTSVIPPTPTLYLAPSPIPDAYGTRVLLLSGTDPHKNLWRLPEVLAHLDEGGGADIRFLISTTREAFLGMRGFDTAAIQRIDRYVEFLGPLSADELQPAYDRCTLLANLSDLESFSNNYLESWLVGRPILASDRDFSRLICGDSAYFVEPHDAAAVARGLIAFSSREVDVDTMVTEGRRRLAALPSLDERIHRIAEILENM